MFKITSKYQTTIPQEIRKQLNLKIGDTIFFEIINGEVVLKKIDSNNKAYLRSIAMTLSEWSSEEDEEAYRDLQDL